MVVAGMAACWAGVSAGQEAPVSARVADVRIEGNKQMTANAVLVHVRTRPGQAYSDQVVKDDERRLLETGRFDSVVATKTPTDKGVVVTFAVVERPLVVSVQFLGNKSLKTEDLAKELGFAANDPMSAFNVEAGRLAIENKYKNSGYYFTAVTADPKALEQRKIVYKITEGPRVRIRKIVFEGDTYFGDLKLRQTVGSSARLWPFIDGFLDTEQVAQDVMALQNQYVSEGYLDAEVGRLLKFSEDRQDVTLTFVIKEGPRYQVNQVIFQGNTVFSNKELAGRIHFAQGAFFTDLTLKRDTKALQNTYGELGYIDATVTSRKQFLDPTAAPPDWAKGIAKPALLNVVFEIKESDQFHVGKIEIRGNSITQSRVIRREMRIFPEQLFNTVALEESRKRLMESRLFENVIVSPAGKEPGVRDALVQVTEGRTAEFLVGVGISTNSGLLGTISFTQRNFDISAWPNSWRELTKAQALKGAGQTFRIVAEPGTEMMRFQVEWLDPAFLDQPYSLGAQAFLFTRQRETYDENRYGVVGSVGHRFANQWYGELAVRPEGVDINNLDKDAPPEVRADEGWSFLTGFKGTLVRDRTDSRWMPSEGDRFMLSAEEVVGSFNFTRVNAEYKFYRTLYTDSLDRKHILATRLAAGDIFAGESPVFEKFYGGGIGSVRGFKYRGISPRSDGGMFDGRLRGEGEPIGGDFMVFAGSEYSFPIFGTEGSQLRGVLFLDTGTVEQDIGITAYRASVGFGIRWAIPLLGPQPMAFDFGFPVSKQDDDDTQIFSFSVGWSF
jgi:outer membrane protein assembly complex protein YaeT